MPRRTNQIRRYVFAALFLVLELPVLAPFVIGAVVTRALLALFDGLRRVGRGVSRAGHALDGPGAPGLATRRHAKS
jgi:hypothetical protein